MDPQDVENPSQPVRVEKMSAKYRYRGYLISNKGYYQPDHHVWWEAIDEKTGEASYHGKTRRKVMQMIDEDFVRDELNAKLPCNMLKIRETLESCMTAMCFLCSNQKNCELWDKNPDLVGKDFGRCTEFLSARAALAEPPRNCDNPKYKTGWDVITEWMNRGVNKLEDGADIAEMLDWFISSAVKEGGDK